MLVVVAGALVLAQTRVGSAFMDRSEKMLASGTIGFEHDPNALWRFAAWGTALTLFVQHPIFGTGYGVHFSPFDVSVSKGGSPLATRVVAVDVDTRPHNTYLTVLYQMGLLGLCSLAAVLLCYFFRGWSLLRRFRRESRSVWLYVALLFQLCMCLYGGLNLMFESPFSASIFWLGLGVGWRIQNLLRAGNVQARV
jgi:O-antigen ligase